MSEREIKRVLREREEAIFQEGLDKTSEGSSSIGNIPKRRNLSCLDAPVDESLTKSLFREDDKLLHFYENKYKFEVKDIRPFAHHSCAKETQDPRYND
jgi:hypothetical protein